MTKKIAVASIFFAFTLILLQKTTWGEFVLRKGLSKTQNVSESRNSLTQTTFGSLINQPSHSPPSAAPSLSKRSSDIQSVLTLLDSSSKALKPTLDAIKTSSKRNPTPSPDILAAVSNTFSTPSNSTTNTPQLTTYNLQPFAPNEGGAQGKPTTSPPPPDISPFIAIGNIVTNPKNTYIVALLGDSMVDTMGRDLPILKDFLKDSYPAYSFALLNYGFGATDMDSGLFRLTHHTTYLDKPYPALLSYRPDILIVESFAYNHWSENQYDLDRHWLTIAKIIDTVKVYSPATQILLFSTIAPNPLTFGDGALNWNPTMKWQGAQTTKAYLENMTRFAASQHYPLADVYHPTMDANGYGIKTYINAGDNIHLSDEGRRFVSRKIVEAIKGNKLIQ